MSNEIFTIPVRKCKRCGRLLTSKEAVEEGYGHICKMKTHAEEEAKKPIDGQINLMDFFENQN